MTAERPLKPRSKRRERVPTKAEGMPTTAAYRAYYEARGQLRLPLWRRPRKETA